MRYAITDLSVVSSAYGLDAADARRMRWLADVRRWAMEGIDFIQLREKALDPGEIFQLARDAVDLLASLRGVTARPKLLMNGRPDLAAASGADGVHLPGQPGELSPGQVRDVYRLAGLTPPVVSVSCHQLPEVTACHREGADLILFGPVFEKRIAGQVVVPGTGLETLQAACTLAAPIPVLALGGVTRETLPLCLEAGAAGVAAIRLFVAS